ncbi:hypothetical protein AVEN_202145-1 [Araneus ventricosus]|uniref:Uncharacterized protein n=1 Tax=Araneus ventricosus TaxID=182803 RepID=A0A4Y2E170_ARAVE|nr:hypothetical protein AVEN_202145-1 [Araneus ventricosus]
MVDSAAWISDAQGIIFLESENGPQDLLEEKKKKKELTTKAYAGSESDDTNTGTESGTDLTIEPILIRSLKSIGNLSLVHEQNTDDRDSRILHDNEDVQELVDWFESHDPSPVPEFVMSISTGMVGDETINCHRSF